MDRPFRVGLLLGAVLEARDLPASQDFYRDVLGDRGTWSASRTTARFSAPSQYLELVHRARPHVPPETARHLALAIGAQRTRSVCEQLARGGVDVSWWREDHPAELDPAPYVDDLSGNRIQLVAGSNGALVDHVGLEFVDLEWAEDLYVKVLGAELDHYHGWSTEHGAEVDAWLAGDDPAAPWTRYTRFSFRSRTDEAHATPQLYLRLGGVRLALFLARSHVQEPPEELVRGAARLVFAVDRPAPEVAAYLAGPGRDIIANRFRGRRIRHEVDGDSVFVRDPGGNFIELRHISPEPT
jgi:catechol 2,3-dioxygenase-like lactoylglutathione lyase family enzyme